MTEVQNLAKSISLRYGTIKRARGCFLYTEKGIRLTDLYQEGGRAILGWGGKGAFTILKNVLERGITGSYFTDFSLSSTKYKSQLSRALSQLFAGDRTAYMFKSKNEALQAAIKISPDSTSIYRPWNPENIDWRDVDCIIFTPALPWTDDIYILVVKDGLVGVSDECKIPNVDFENANQLSAPICAAVTRSVFDLIKALQEREEKHWFIFDKILTKYWTRKGPYLFPKISQDEYSAFVEHCLECELVISPEYNQPSIVPFGAALGAFRKLEKNPYGSN
ncbi:MAG: hypothetical protein KBT11_01580 [Treponema sp.]|nr:hypothetical protein [Candidatus Treponema equifaecale]